MKTTYSRFAIAGLLCAALIFTACDDDPYRIDYSLAKEHLYDTSGASKVTTSSGVIYYVIEEGNGPDSVDIRDQIYAYYTGRYLKNMEIIPRETSYINKRTSPAFISNITSKPDGFADGVIGMKEGEKRVILIPPPANSGSNDSLRYDIELDQIVR